MAARKVISGLPAPEVDITKTTYFMNFPSSGGPFYDAALHNQAATIKLLQSIRMDLATQMPFDEVKQKHSWKYVEEVNKIMSNSDHVHLLVDIAQTWQQRDENGMVLTYSEQLEAMAKSLYAEIQTNFDPNDWEEPTLVVEDSTRELLTLLKKIGEHDDHKRDLELAIAHWMKDNERKLSKPTKPKTQPQPAAAEDDEASAESEASTPRAASARSSNRQRKAATTRSTASGSRTASVASNRPAEAGGRDQTRSRSGQSRVSGGSGRGVGSGRLTSRASARSRVASGGSEDLVDLTGSDAESQSTTIHHSTRSVDPASVGVTNDSEQMEVEDSENLR